MKCPKCGYDKLQPNYKFCPKCRTSLTSLTPEASKSGDSYSVPSSTAKVYQLSDPGNGPVINVRHAADDGRGNMQNAFGNMRQTISEQVAPRVGNEYETRDLEFVKNKAIWKIEKGEVARHISPREIDNLDNLDGVIIQDGVTAIIEVDGEVVAKLNGGVYNFATTKTVEEAYKKIGEEKSEAESNLGLVGHIKRGVRAIGRFIFGRSEKDLETERIEKEKHFRKVVRRITDNSVVSIYLKADRPFPSVFGIQQTADAAGRNIVFEPYDIKARVLDVKVGVSMQLAIGDFDQFIANYLVGNDSVTISDIGLSINPYLRSLLQNSLRYEDIEGSALSEEQYSTISAKIKNLESILPGIKVVNVLEITFDNADLERFRSVEKELFSAERELDYLKRTNEFKNRLAEVQYAQAITSARSELDHKILLDEVNKDGLIHADEMDAFVALLASQKRIREAKTETDEEKALLELKGNRLVNEDDYSALEDSIKNKQFERSQVGEVLRITSLANTAKIRQETEAALAMQTLRSQIDLDRVKTGYQDEKDINAAEKEKTILEKKIEAQSMLDDYSAKVAEKDYDLERRKKLDELDILRQKAQMARENMLAMNEDARKDKQLEYAHEDKAGERELERERIHASMTAEQLVSLSLKDLDANAQAEYMKAQGSSKENEILRQASADKEALLREMLQMQQASSDKMLEFAKSANATTASLVGGISAQKAQAEKELRESMERVATSRIGEVSDMKKEYRDELHMQQKRTDTTQDKALNYTTKISLADTKSPSSAKSSPSKTYYVEEFGKSLSFETLAAYVANGVVMPMTEITVDGSTVNAMDIDELFPVLAKYCSVKCPNCGSTAMRGLICPDCGTEIE